MNKRDAIETLKSMLPEKISYAELVGAVGCYGTGGYVYADPEPYAIEMAISALEKQMPKKPDKDDCCTTCSTYLKDDNDVEGDYCPECGQAIDWRNEDE